MLREDSLSKNHLKILLVFLLASLTIRLALINWYSAPYTDGVFLMTLFETFNENNNYPPLYSALLYLINNIANDPMLSGRLISIFSGVGLIALIFHFGRRFFDEKTGLLAALIYGTAPLVFRWDLRVMTDSLFALLFFTAIYFLCLAFADLTKKNFMLFNVFAVLSALTRYQGLVFLPLTFYLGYRLLAAKSSLSKWLTALAAVVCWLSVPAWMLYRGFGQVEQYADSMASLFWVSVGQLLGAMQMLLHAVSYAFGYLATLMMFYGIVRYYKKEDRLREFLPFCCYLFIAFWIAHSAFMRAFQTRYFLPLWSLAALFTAWGITQLSRNKPYLARVFLGIILGGNVFWSGMVLHFQRDSFGALRRSAEYIRDNLPEEEIMTAEFYKMAYFTKRHRKGSTLNTPYRLSPLRDTWFKPGTYIYADNHYQPDFFKEYSGFPYEVVYRDQETVMAILPDVVADRSKVNSIEWLAVRFLPQTTNAMILKVVE